MPKALPSSVAAVPAAALCNIAPRRIGNDMAVFAQQWLDRGQYSRMGNGALAGGAAIEHFIPEAFIVHWRASRSRAPVSWVVPEYPADVAFKGGHLTG